MNDQKALIMIAQANELFDCAKEELSRPEEDVVGYSVCHDSYKSIEKYLIAFLMLYGKDIHASMSMETMLKECQAIDDRFQELKLDPLYKTEFDADVYMDMSTVNLFISLAEKTKGLVSASIEQKNIY